MLIDIVSKNGNLMLSIPVRGEGTIDDDEVKVLEGLAAWMAPNSEGIYATRPWKVYGEGPATNVRPARGQSAQIHVRGHPLHGQGRYALCVCPGLAGDGKAVIKTLAKGGRRSHGTSARWNCWCVGELTFTRDAAGLTINLPDKKPYDYAFGFKITPS